jgi:hypothetical protein
MMTLRNFPYDLINVLLLKTKSLSLRSAGQALGLWVASVMLRIVVLIFGFSDPRFQT